MRVCYVSVFTIAVILRTIQLLTGGGWANPLQREPTEEVRIAQHIASGRGFVTPFYHGTPSHFHPSAHSPPGYPYLLGGLIRISELLHIDGLWPYRTALLLGILAGSAAVVLLARAGGRVGGPICAWSVGLLAAVWPTLVTQSVILWDTPYAILALSVAANLTVTDTMVRSRGWYACAGFFGGLATLFNPSVGPFFAAALAARLSTECRRMWLIAGIAMGLCLTPWMVRCAIVFERFVPLRHNAGLELWLGNQPDSDGTTGKAIIRHPIDNPQDQDQIVQDGEGVFMQSRASQAAALIRAEPIRFLKLSARRFGLYWLGDLTRPTVFAGLTMPMIFGINILKGIVNGTVLVVALTGLRRWQPSAGRRALAFGLLFLPIPYYFTHVQPNYRVFVDPIICLLAGTVVARMVGRIWPIGGTGSGQSE